MKKINTFKSKSKIEIELESYLYINRKVFFPPKLTQDEEKAVNDIKKDGFTVIENFISENTLKDMKNSFENDLRNGRFEMPVLAQSKIDPIKHAHLIKDYLRGNGQLFKENGVAFDRDEFTSLDQCVNDFKPSTLKSFFNPSSKLFFEVMLSRKIQNIAESYLGVKPYLMEAYTRRNFPAKYSVANHHWHRDTNNKTFLLKAFLFLTDCNENNGPHYYLKGSHRDLKLNHRLYYSDDEVQKHGDLENNLVTSTVKAGTLILEDTRGLHKAGIPKESSRDLVYSVFFPMKAYSRWRNSYYKIDKSIYKSLGESQKRYIPKNCIV